MESFARLWVHRITARATVAIVFCLAVASVGLARKVKHDDDILAFLPQDNPEVQTFYDINKRFGGLEVALVGIKTKSLFTEAFLQKLQQVTRALKEIQGLSQVLSLTNVVDFRPDRELGGIITGPLVDQLPQTPEQSEALRRKVMSRDLVVGNLVSADGQGVLIYCFLGYGTNFRSLADQIHSVVQRHFSPQQTVWGGNPFISTYIYNSTQKDLRRLTPWAVLAIIVIMIAAFRDIVAPFLALVSTAVGVLVALGLMAALGVRFNIVLSSMPIVMLALGSAYAIHVLACYYRFAREHDTATAVVQAMCAIGPTVLAAGLTTVASLLSFVLMDIEPLRVFGLFTAIGLLVMLALALTFVPAVIFLTHLKPKPGIRHPLERWVVALTVFARRHRWAVGGALLVLAGTGLFWLGQVDTRMDQRTFFSPESPPDRAERYLSEHFGGSQFIQLHVKGDMTDPLVLREIQWMSDELRQMPHISSVLHVSQAVAQVNEAMTGHRRIPDQTDQVKVLYTFLASDGSVKQLVSDERHQALMHLKLDSNRPDDYEAALAAVEQWVADNATGPRRVAERSDGPSAAVQSRAEQLVTARIVGAAEQLQIPLPPEAPSRIAHHLPQVRQVQPPPQQLKHALRRFLTSAECVVPLPASSGPLPPEDAVAQAVARLGPEPTDSQLQTTLARVLDKAPDAPLIEDLAFSLSTPLREIYTSQAASAAANALIQQVGLQVPAQGKGQRFRQAVAWALMDLDVPAALLPAARQPAAAGQPGLQPLSVQVSGLPVMNRGLSRSVEANQLKSLGFALLLVLIIMTVLLRSLWAGLLVVTPVLLTLVVVYGGMGLGGIHLDIGTSMLASLVLGAGVDYAVHLVAAWRAPPEAPLTEAAARAARYSGLAIWTNALMVAAGFCILTLGEARPLKNVGGLTSAGMIAAALVTFLVIPVLARRRYYRHSVLAGPVSSAEDAMTAVSQKLQP